MADLKAGFTYYESGAWPATEVKVINVGINVLVSKPDGTGARYASRINLHPTRMAADEATLAEKRVQLANFELRTEELRAEVASLMSKKGQGA